jgi:hypothetical protein
MGAISSFVTGITSAVGAVKSVVQLVENPASLNPLNTSSNLIAQQQSLALKQLQQKQQADEQNLEAQTALQKEQIAASGQSTQDQAQAALIRAVAKQRADFGAQGVSSGDGSGQAVLLGLYDQTDAQAEDRQRIDNLRNAAIDQNVADRYNLDVLQRTQLQQQQKLQRVAEGF